LDGEVEVAGAVRVHGLSIVVDYNPTLESVEDRKHLSIEPTLAVHAVAGEQTQVRKVTP